MKFKKVLVICISALAAASCCLILGSCQNSDKSSQTDTAIQSEDTSSETLYGNLRSVRIEGKVLELKDENTVLVKLTQDFNTKTVNYNKDDEIYVNFEKYEDETKTKLSIGDEIATEPQFQADKPTIRQLDGKDCIFTPSIKKNQLSDVDEDSTSETTVTSESVKTMAGFVSSHGFIATVKEVKDNGSLVMKQKEKVITPDLPIGSDNERGNMVIADDLVIDIEKVKQVKCDREYNTIEVLDENYKPKIGDLMEVTFIAEDNPYEGKSYSNYKYLKCLSGVCYIMEKE